MRRAAAVALLLLTAAADPPPGATNCSGCHASGFMPINGRDAGKLTATMLAFRSAERPSTVMGRLIKGFSPDEIRAISTWISAQTSAAQN